MLGTTVELGPGLEVGGFRLQRRIGAGTTGEVWAAQDLALGRQVALKFIRPELLDDTSVDRFLEEARTTARFSHPHIVAIHSVGAHTGRPYLALEFLEGESLRARVAHGALPVLEASRLGLAIAEALAEAHRHGIIHSDLKPENVLLPPDGRLRVLDFGLARQANASSTAASGTPAYMAPERWRGVAPAPPIDLWALGVLLFECVTGERPVKDAELARAVFQPPPLLLPPPLSGHPLGALISRCLAPAPTERPSAEEAVRALAQIIASGRTADPARPPFRGLRPFSEADAQDFHGRGAEVTALVELLREEPVALVVGASGAGKTSLVQAGLIPRLRETDDWKVIAVRPGSDPLRALAQAVLPDDAGGATAWSQTLQARPGELARRLRDRFGRARLLLSVDAFEEVFTLASPQLRTAFAECLGAFAAAEESWRVVIALREEYLGRLAALPPLRRSLRATCVLGPLGAQALRAALEVPLSRAGYRADSPDLLSTVVAEVQAQRAGLPALQFAAQLLWDRRDEAHRLIRAEVYREIGGVGGALAAHGARVLRQLSPEELMTARRLLLQLVTAEGTRQPRVVDDLVGGDPRARVVLDALVDQRLLSVRQDTADAPPTVELAHEALTSAWPELARWIEESHEARSALFELEQAALLWERRGQREEETWSADAVRLARRRLEAGTLPPSPRVHAFLAASQQRQRRQQRRRRLLVGSGVTLLGAAALIATAAAVAFRSKEQEAVRQQAQIRLAAADIGEFELLLQPKDFDGERWVDAAAAPPARWELMPVGTDRSYAEGDVVKGAPVADPEGGYRQAVEAPSREAILQIERPGCAPSRIHLRRLPSFAQRGRMPRETLRLPYPSCAASAVGMVEIPAGPYVKPPVSEVDAEQIVEVDAFAIDRTEVFNAQFALFEEQLLGLGPHERVTPPTHPIYAHAWAPHSPVSGVDAFTAAAYCAWLGKTLPTIEQWQKAARGGLHLDAERKVENPAPRRRHPWTAAEGIPANILGGDSFAGPAPVGSFPLDRSPYGVLDMGGNLAEWTATAATLPEFARLRVVAGGRWDAPADTRQHELEWMNHLPERRFDFALGLRCVRPLD